MEYDTTFNLGNYYMSWVTFRFTEFEDFPNSPMPTVGLECLIHKTKLQSVHEYFWNIISKEAPQLNNATNVGSQLLRHSPYRHCQIGTAYMIIELDLIKAVPSLKGWAVRSTGGQLHSVTLFGENGLPRQYCAPVQRQ